MSGDYNGESSVKRYLRALCATTRPSRATGSTSGSYSSPVYSACWRPGDVTVCGIEVVEGVCHRLLSPADAAALRRRLEVVGGRRTATEAELCR